MTTTGAPERKHRGLGLFFAATDSITGRGHRAATSGCPLRRLGILHRAATSGRPLRRLGILVALVAILAGALPASAAPRSRPSYGPDVVRRIGLGMLSPRTPVGFRYLTSPRAGFEVGMGANTLDAEGLNGLDVRLDAALLMTMAPGDRVNFFLRPGIQFASEHRTHGTYTTVGLSIGFSFEMFLTRDFSLIATQGLRLDMVSPPGDDPAGDSDRTRMGLFGAGVPQFGFYYYLPDTP